MNKEHKKSRVLTYFFSFIPGIGFMYRGWMKKGFSYLTLFFVTITLITWFEIELFSVVPVLIWFYAFFDQINTFSLSEEESKEVGDTIILQKLFDFIEDQMIQNNPRLIGGGLLLFGSYWLTKYIAMSVVVLLPPSFKAVILSLIDYTPYLIASCIILYCGTCFMEGKVKLLTLLREKSSGLPLQKQSNEMIEKTGVVYYMNQSDLHREHNDQVNEREEENEARQINEIEDMNKMAHSTELIQDKEILHISREQLLLKAKELLEDETYKKIHDMT